jgi:hypothetical protein
MEDRAGKEGVVGFLTSLRNKGAKVWIDGGLLRYQAPKDVLTSLDMGTLRALKADIISFLQTFESRYAAEVPLEPRLRDEPVPLTFAQQWAWNRWDPGRRRYRTVHTATRLSGRLRIGILGECIRRLVQRHESLRTRIVVKNGIARQVIDEEFRHGMEIVDLTILPPTGRDAAAQQLISDLVEEAVVPAQGPLFAVRLLKFANTDHVLVTVLDHLVTDDASTTVMLREIFKMYGQLVSGLEPSLPETLIQLGDYAIWQYKSTSAWIETHSRYWDERLLQAARLRIFPEEGRQAERYSRVKVYPVQFGSVVSAGLRALSRQQRTSVAVSAMCAYIALLAQWCRTTDVVLPFLTMGRSRPDLENTIGRLVYPLFVRIQLKTDDTFRDLLARANREYGAAVSHRDSGRIAARIPTPQFAFNSAFNWIPQEIEADPKSLESISEVSKEPLDITTFAVRNAGANIELNSDVNREPVLVLSDQGDEITGFIVYLESCVSLSSMERFAKNVCFFTETLVNCPDKHLLSTFPI